MSKPAKEFNVFPYPITPKLLRGIRETARRIMHDINSYWWRRGICLFVEYTLHDAAFLYVFWNAYAMETNDRPRPLDMSEYLFRYYMLDCNTTDFDFEYMEGHEQRDRTFALATIASMTDEDLKWFLLRPCYNTLVRKCLEYMKD